MEEKTLNFKNVLKAILLCSVVSFILVSALAVCVSLLDVSDRVITNSIFAISSGTAILSAFVLAKNADRNGLLNGLMLGAGYFALIAVASLILNGAISFDSHNMLRCFSILASGMLGGVLGINSKK